MTAVVDFDLDEVSEKTDGQAITFTWDGSEVRVARNKGDLRSGGMSADDLAAKFRGRGAIEDAFNSAFEILDLSISAIPPRQRDAIFQGGNVWYTAEVMYPASRNVISYDRKNLLFHRSGIITMGEDGTPVDDPHAGKRFDLLIGYVDRMQDRAEERDWNVSGPGIVTLEALDDGTVLQRAIAEIDSAASAVGVGDGDTVGDFLEASILQEIDRSLPDLREDRKSALAKRMAGISGSPTVNQVTKGLDSSYRKKVVQFARQAKDIRARAIWPLESAVHDFAVDVLEGVQSLFMNDNEAEVARLRSQVDQAISTIESSGNEAAIAILDQQLRKLKSVDAITTAMEGVVFQWGGETYKLTGNFSPINQILGLFRFGRGKDIPPLQRPEKQDESHFRSWARGLIT